MLDTAFVLADIRHRLISDALIAPDAPYALPLVLQTAFVPDCVKAVSEGLRR